MSTNSNSVPSIFIQLPWPFCNHFFRILIIGVEYFLNTIQLDFCYDDLLSVNHHNREQQNCTHNYRYLCSFDFLIEVCFSSFRCFRNNRIEYVSSVLPLLIVIRIKITFLLGAGIVGNGTP
jgi:hypothetical protein